MLEKVICALMTWKRGISILTGKPEGNCIWMKCFNFWKWVFEIASKSTIGITYVKQGVIATLPGGLNVHTCS